VVKIHILLVVGPIASNLMVRFTALDGACCAGVPCWHIPSTRIRIIPIVEMLHRVGWVGTITNGLGGQGNGSIAAGWRTRWMVHGGWSWAIRCLVVHSLSSFAAANCSGSIGWGRWHRGIRGGRDSKFPSQYNPETSSKRRIFQSG